MLQPITTRNKRLHADKFNAQSVSVLQPYRSCIKVFKNSSNLDKASYYTIDSIFQRKKRVKSPIKPKPKGFIDLNLRNAYRPSYKIERKDDFDFTLPDIKIPQYRTTWKQRKVLEAKSENLRELQATDRWEISKIGKIRGED